SFDHLPQIAEEEGVNQDELEPLIHHQKSDLKHYSALSTDGPSLHPEAAAAVNQYEKIILIAGGAGISLIYPMLSHYHNIDRFDVSFLWILRNEQDIVTFDTAKSENVHIWHTAINGRPNVVAMLDDTLDLENNSYDKIHIIGCGPTALMEDVKRFATEKIIQDQTVNLILEEFTF
ncbi:hypothetical protein WICPIJ_005420, partial [Wickerhamomyces pijperi]